MGLVLKMLIMAAYEALVSGALSSMGLAWSAVSVLAITVTAAWVRVGRLRRGEEA